MFGIFKRRSEAKLTLEQKLAVLAECGLSLAPPFTVQNLLESWPREEYEKPAFDLTVMGLAMTEEQPPWRHHCVNAWHFDTECIEDHGSYVRIAERMAEMTQGALVLEEVRDYVDIEAGVASLDFRHAGQSVHIDFKVKDDWADPAVFSHFIRLLSMSNPSKVFLYFDTKGQDCILACVTRDQFTSLKKAGVEFELLK